MSWTSGEYITANKINSENNKATVVKAYPHQAWDWRSFVVYFYVMKPEGENFMHYTSQRSAGCHHKLVIYRLENSQWVEKGRWDYSGGQLEGYYKSYGPGNYSVSFVDHNNTPTFTYYLTATNTIRGNYLAKIGSNPYLDTNSGPFIWRDHTAITAADLNAGKVYTL